MEQSHSQAAYTMVMQSMNSSSPVNNRRQLLQAMKEMANSGGDFAAGFFETITEPDGKKTDTFQICLEKISCCDPELTEDFVSLLVSVVRSVGIDVAHLTSLLRLVGSGDSWPRHSAIVLIGMADRAPSEHRYVEK
jgi:hypothetical protein